MSLPIELPTLQNWSCHNCGGCCRQHAIEITAAEHQRIVEQGWTGEAGFGPEQPLFTWSSGPPWKKRYRLAHREDGACVFLDERGLCRIHARFGEAAKPLACQVYPYALHPAGKRVTVSLRFSCPSVVANRGKPLTEKRSELKEIERLVVPEGADRTPPPRISHDQELAWPDFLRFIDALDATLDQPGVPLVRKLLQALFWIRLVGQSRFEKIQGGRITEFLELVTGAAVAEIPESPEDIAAWGAPSPLARSQFRLLVAQYARKDTAVEVRQGWRGRLRLLKAALRFAKGQGTIPRLQEQFAEIPFAAIETPFGPWPAEVEEILTRYFRVKVQGLHFCGRAYYDIPLVEGFQSLALMLPATFWIARWLAAGEGRSSLSTEDVSRALAIADHHHGYSPIFGQWSFRRRVRTLASTGDLEKLCAWYAR